MIEKLCALAAIAATSAFAQSTVTISGFANGSYDLFSVAQGNATTARTGNTSENRVTDNSSRIIFNSNEDLGGGMRAFAQFDLRIPLDAGGRAGAVCSLPATPAVNASGVVTTTVAIAAVAAGGNVCSPAVNPLNGGNSHVGLTTSLGSFRLGRQDVHYTEGGNFAPVSNPTIHSHAGLLTSAAASTSVGRTSRISNLLWYTSPTMGGFTGTLGYSTNGHSASGTTEVENDMASGQRKGNTQYARLGFAQGPVTAVVSYINEKADYIGTAANSTALAAGAAATFAAANPAPDRSGTIVSFKYDLGMAKLGAAVANNNSQVFAAGAGTDKSKRTVTQFGVGVPMGASNVALTYTKLGNETKNTVEQANTGASAVALAYSYDLSKRTQVFAGMQVINNKSAGAHQLFYNADNAVGSAGSGVTNAGEKHSVTSFGVRHSF